MTASGIPGDDPATRGLLRHVVATLAYRAGKTVRGTPEAFADFMVAPGSNTPRSLLAHMGDLMDWSLRMARDGESKWTNATPLPWTQEQDRFFATLGALDAHLASAAPLRWDPGVLFQSGLADALTHTGQLAILRRLSGHKMKGENYAKADIVAGRTGLEQTPPEAKHEFD
jgi:hypothetical protein